DEVLDAAFVLERDASALAPLVGERDPQAARQERRLAQALFERREVVVERLHDLVVREERDRGACLARGGTLLQRALRLAALVFLRPRVAVPADLDEQSLRERVDDRDADAVQPARDLVAAAVAELAAGVEHGQ